MTWNRIYKNRITWIMSESPQENMSEVINLLRRHKAKTILDLGCGSGRHTVILAKAGFDVHAMDNSIEGLKITKDKLKKIRLKAKIKKASCFRRLPYRSNFFDAIVSVQVIYHSYHKQVKFCISEIERILKPDGIAFVTLAGPKKLYRKKDRTKYKLIAKDTYLPTSGEEKGIVHYLYSSKKSILNDFKNFKILKFSVDKYKHWCLICQK